MNIADLRETPVEKKATKNGKVKEPVGGIDGFAKRPPTIHLHDGHLEKMGIHELPDVGQHMELHGSGHVVHASETKDVDGKAQRSVHLSVERLGLSKRKGQNEGDIKSDLRDAAKGVEKTGPNIAKR